MAPLFCDQVESDILKRNLHWILSEKSVLEDFTLYALKDFNTCAQLKCELEKMSFVGRSGRLVDEVGKCPSNSISCVAKKQKITTKTPRK